jgi:hypothetical protein
VGVGMYLYLYFAVGRSGQSSHAPLLLGSRLVPQPGPGQLDPVKGDCRTIITLCSATITRRCCELGYVREITSVAMAQKNTYSPHSSKIIACNVFLLYIATSQTPYLMGMLCGTKDKRQECGQVERHPLRKSIISFCLPAPCQNAPTQDPQTAPPHVERNQVDMDP